MSHSVIVIKKPEDKPVEANIVVSDANIETAINVAVGQYKTIAGTAGLNEQILRGHLEKYNRVDYHDTSIQIKVG